MGSITFGSTYVYSCMTISNAAVTSTLTLIMKFDTTNGAYVAHQELTTASAVGCQVLYISTSSKVLLGISYSTSASEIISYDVSSTNLALITSVTRLRFSTTGYKQTNSLSARMFLQGTTTQSVYLFYPSVATGNNYASMFITKFTDTDTMTWPTEIGCPAIHTVTAAGTWDAGYSSGTLYTAAILFKLPAEVPNANPNSTDFNYYYLKGPDDIAIYYDSGAAKKTLDLKFSFSITCSVWARPTPSILLNKIGPVNGFSVSNDVYPLA